MKVEMDKIITSELAEEYLKSNIEICGNMMAFLCGEVYKLSVESDTLHPTSRSMVMKTIYKFYKEYPDLNIKEMLTDSLTKLIEKGDEDCIYSAFDTIAYQMIAEKNQTAPFELNLGELLPILRKRIIEENENLKASRRYVASKYQDGYLGYFEEANQEVIEKTGRSIL
jgi:hypothetical protein